MRISTCKIASQFYILPSFKITHERWLNGDLEFIIGWFNRLVIFSI